MRIVVLLATALLLAGCGGDEAGEAEPPPTTPFGDPAPDEPLSVSEALELEGQDVLVTGYVHAADETRLCELLAESFPPQCGEPSMRVEELDLEAIEGLREEEGVRWSETKAVVSGTIDDGALRATGVERAEHAGDVEDLDDADEEDDDDDDVGDEERQGDY
jgi:hypothetical protein